MSSILLYCALQHEDNVCRAKPDPFGYEVGYIDKKIERWIKEFSKLRSHDFDEFTAARNLTKLKLLQPTEEGRYRVKDLDSAIIDLERILADEIVKTVYSTKHDSDWNQLVDKRPFSDKYR